MENFIWNVEKKWSNTSTVNSNNNMNEWENNENKNRQFTQLNYNNDQFIVYSNETRNAQKITIGYKSSVVCVVFILLLNEKTAHIQLLDKFRKCKKNNQYPTSKDINKMVHFCIKHAEINGMREITLEDRSSLICQKNGKTYSASLSDYYMLKKYNSYYGYHFGFVLEDKNKKQIFAEDIAKLKKTRIKDVNWQEIFPYLEKNEEWEEWQKLFKKIHKNCGLNKLLEEMQNNFCSIINPLTLHILKNLNISTMRGNVFVKNL